MATGYQGSADISYNERDDLIVVPVYEGNRLAFIKIKPFSADLGN